MSKLQLIYYPEPILTASNAPVEAADARIQTLIDDMIETMYAESGIGLAAPQVGESLKITVIDVSPEQNDPQIFINPEIIDKTNIINSEEGCLSIPGYRDVIKRSETITVKARDREFQEFEVTADGILSRCLQHEIDHLNGILFIDHLGRLKKQLFKKWLSKQDFSQDYSED